MAELIVVEGRREERLLFEGGASPGTSTSPGEVSVGKWFKDKFYGDGSDGDGWITPWAWWVCKSGPTTAPLSFPGDNSNVWPSPGLSPPARR